MRNILFLIFVVLIAFGCNQNETNDWSKSVEERENMSYELKNHSYSNVSEVSTIRLELDLEVDFERQIIHGVASHHIGVNQAEKIIFDIKKINIEKVTLGNGENEQETNFEIGENHDVFGAPLIVHLEENVNQVNIYYSTSPDADAIDWLDASMTRSGKYPFLYTQGQAILTRSWIPIQDVPSNRFTYSAKITVPQGMLALMSATNPKEVNNNGVYYFEMKQPTSSYLVALCVGELEYVKLDDRSGVYAEPSIVHEAADEFKDIPKMINAAEKLYGDYRWGMYDVLFLPASFPFGGMENPRLTFATPTVLAGDGSLTSLVAHELAHSWSGNLVTNATWEDFWLNEGFTVYFENRIMEELYGVETAEMLYMIEYQELNKTIADMKKEGEERNTWLKLDLGDNDPDDGMTDIAYVKGSLFLKTLEEKVGREKFDEFVKGYFNSHSFNTITTEEFVAYLEENLIKKEGVVFDYKEWIYGVGIPVSAKEIKSSKLEKVEELARQVQAGEELPKDLKREDKLTQEWLAFIRAFNSELSIETMRKLDSQFHFKDCGNSEIMAEWYVLAIQNEYHEVDEDMRVFLNYVGRRKFLEPIYITLRDYSEESRSWGIEVFEESKKNYHPISSITIARILGVDL